MYFFHRENYNLQDCFGSCFGRLYCPKKSAQLQTLTLIYRKGQVIPRRQFAKYQDIPGCDFCGCLAEHQIQTVMEALARFWK